VPKMLDGIDSDDNETPAAKNYGEYEDQSANMNFD
tara:strand:+ start:807 stop:911 length:105 start_codon:yes stop_codon:yes gene_type:complete